MSPAVAAFAESEKLINKLVVKVGIREVVNVFDWFTSAPLAHPLFPFDHMLAL